MAHFDLVIFDCDGVLVDSERLSVEVEVGILGDLGWDITREEIVERFLGISDADYVASIESHLGRRLPETWLQDMEPRYREAFARDLVPVTGIVDLLDALSAAHLASCVASSGSHDKIRHTLGLTGLHERFEGRIYSSADVESGKPAPDLFLHAAASMGVSPERCAVIEDSPAGLTGALAAGMTAMAYDGGLVPPGRLQMAGVTVVTSMSELVPLLLDR